MELETLEIALRLGAAALCGTAIGLNRDMRNKPIGMRTLALVALGAAVVTVAAVNYHGLDAQPDALSRVVQGVVQGVMAGISFIGAGVILRDTQEHSVEGLTTAATVWVTAAVGIACGLAAWATVAVAVALSLFVLIGMSWIEKLLTRS